MFGCDRFFYYPNAVRYGTPDELDLTYENVRFPTRDGSMLHGYWFPAQDTADPASGIPGRHGSAVSSPSNGGRPLQIAGHRGPALQDDVTHSKDGGTQRARGTVLHLHGNAGNVTGHFQHVAWLPAVGWNVLTFDYRGYGQSEGSVTRENTIADAHAALNCLLHRPDVDPGRIVAFGQGLGGAIGIVLAAERQEIRGFATDGAFDSYRAIVRWHIHRNPLLLCAAWWIPLVLRDDGFDPIDSVARIAPRPLLIMHGTCDRVVDPRMARRLYDAAGEPRELWLAEGADHYGALQDHCEQARLMLLDFFARCIGCEPG